MNSPADIAPLPLIKKSDQVFQLSLTELAFIVIFILLILFGWLVQHQQQRNAKLEKELVDAQKAAVSAEAWGDIRNEVSGMLRDRGATDKDINKSLSDLVERRTALLENQRLRRRIEELDAQLTALTALKTEVEKAANKAEATEKIVGESLALKSALEKTLGRPVGPAEIPKLVEELAVAVKLTQDSKETGVDVRELVRTNERMKNLVAHYERRLNMRGGIDFPPCWLDSNTGKVEYLFNVDLIPSGVLLTPSWPSYRESEARALPSANALLNPKGLALAQFNALMQGIDQKSRAANCRHDNRIQPGEKPAIISVTHLRDI